MNAGPDGAAGSLTPGRVEATTFPCVLMICKLSNAGWEASDASKRAGSHDLSRLPTLSSAIARSSALRSPTQSLTRVSTAWAVATALAFAWPIVLSAIQLDMTNPRKTEIGIDTSSTPATARTE